VGAPGCIDSPPEYSVPDPVPPVLIVSRADPPPTVVTAISQPPVDFNVPFRSDDLEGLKAYFLLDLQPAEPGVDYQAVQKELPVPADSRPFAEQVNRKVEYPWTWSAGGGPAPGCHTMTMILSHVSNFVEEYVVRDDLDSAQMTWFLNVLSPDGTSTPQSCVTASQPGTTH
jgi:hypothetical protein